MNIEGFVMNEFDVIIIGGGGAGLTAAIYTSRAELTTGLFEKNVTGGQISITDKVENFPGFPNGIMGPDIGMQMEEQARNSGAHIIFEEVSAIEKSENGFKVVAGNTSYSAKAVICAMGAYARMLHVPGEKEHIGKGVSYCATCDAPFFRNKKIVVVGGGDSAIQEALFLSKFAAEVRVVHRRDALRAGPILQQRAFNNDKICFEWNSVVAEIHGDPMVNKVSIRDVKDNSIRDIEIDGVFVFIGHDPASQLVDTIVRCDESGYIVTDSHMHTSNKGMFACGEVRSGAVWQLIAACGEGCQAALAAQHYLENRE